jgi:GNAT superfamily N-acetyltransferase
MIDIRKATTSDISAIVGFQLKMASETEKIQLELSTVYKGVERVFENPSIGHYWIAEFEGKILGSMLNLFEWSDWRNGNFIWVHSVFIIPEFRNRGVFSKMYAHIKSLVENSDEYKGIRLFVDINNLKAQSVYSVLGMDDEHYKLYEWMKP